MIPKIVYTFWDGDMSVYEQACLQNVKEMNPGFEVVLLSSDSVENKPTNYDELPVQFKSDWARVEAVERTGGVWIDMACIMLKPLEAWIDFDSDIFHGFEVPFDCAVIENWAFAAPVGCPLVKQWKKEHKQAIEKGFERYNHENDIPPCLEDHLPYLTCHQALHIASQKTPEKKYKIMNSIDEGMPYDIISKCDWNNLRFVDILKREKNLDSIFIKLNGSMRKSLHDVGVRKMNTHEKSHKDRYSHVEQVLNIRIGQDWGLNIWITLLILICVTVLAVWYKRYSR